MLHGCCFLMYCTLGYKLVIVMIKNLVKEIGLQLLHSFVISQVPSTALLTPIMPSCMIDELGANFAGSILKIRKGYQVGTQLDCRNLILYDVEISVVHNSDSCAPHRPINYLGICSSTGRALIYRN